jgi:arsenate reductase (thioredoxin)
MNNKLLFLLIYLLTFISLLVNGQTDNVKSNMQVKRTILFVCEHGAGRSAIAASYFNKNAERQGIKYYAIFRGIEPQEALGLSTKNGLIKDSVDVTSLIPIKLSKKDVDSAYKVITLDCNLPDIFTKADMHWTGIPMNGNYEVSRDKIIVKVDSLIAIISKKHK